MFRLLDYLIKREVYQSFLEGVPYMYGKSRSLYFLKILSHLKDFFTLKYFKGILDAF